MRTTLSDFERFVLSSFIGISSDYWEYDPEIYNTVGIFAKFIDEKYGLPIVIIGTKTNAAEVFVFTESDRPLVVLDLSYLDNVFALRSTFRSGDVNFLTLAYSSIFSGIIGQQLVFRGITQLAHRAFRLAYCRGVVVPVQYAGIEMEMAPLDENYLTAWFFALCHEIAHIIIISPQKEFTDKVCLLDKKLEIDPRIWSYSNINFFLTPEYLIDKRRKQLRTEILCDCIAIEILFEFSVFFSKDFGLSLSVERMTESILMTFFAMLNHEMCSLITVNLARTKTPQYSFYEDFELRLDMVCRQLILLHEQEHQYFEYYLQEKLDEILSFYKKIVMPSLETVNSSLQTRPYQKPSADAADTRLQVQARFPIMSTIENVQILRHTSEGDGNLADIYLKMADDVFISCCRQSNIMDSYIRNLVS